MYMNIFLLNFYYISHNEIRCFKAKERVQPPLLYGSMFTVLHCHLCYAVYCDLSALIRKQSYNPALALICCEF
jgi:hypothetical protein